MLDTSIHEKLAEWLRAQLAAGSSYDDVLAVLRHRGLEKFECVTVMTAATGLPHGHAKSIVHNSQIWADRREVDAHLEDVFFRAVFIEALASGGSCDAPAEWAAEFRDRQHRATTLLDEIATSASTSALIQCRQFAAHGKLGKAFAALVAAGQRNDMPTHYWQMLDAVADALCLTEIIDDGSSAGDDDYLHAARIVRQRLSALGTTPQP